MKTLFELIRLSMIRNGELLPTNDEEVEQFMEDVIIEKKSSEADLEQTAQLMLAGKDIVPASKTALRIVDVSNTGMAAAARKGGEISEAIREKMRKDRKDSERKKGRD